MVGVGRVASDCTHRKTLTEQPWLRDYRAYCGWFLIWMEAQLCSHGEENGEEEDSNHSRGPGAKDSNT